MSEPVEPKRSLLAMFTRKDFRHLVLSIVAATIAGWACGIAFESDKRTEFMAVRYDAYATVAQFAPWNIAERYVTIVFTQGDAYAEELARQKEQQALVWRNLACNLRGSAGPIGSSQLVGDNPCKGPERPKGIRAFYLSAHVPVPLRFITAFFDLLLHAFVDQGVIGFIVALAQILLGVLLTRWLVKSSRLQLHTLASYVLGLPLAVLALGSIAAIPLWIVALIGLMALKASPLGALGAQAGVTGWCVRFVAHKTAEELGHAAIMKQLKRVVHD